MPALPTVRGAQLLTALAGGKAGAGELQFVNEFELKARHDDEMAGWPDFAAVWPDALVMIELKTEPGSHRRGQLAHYDDLARHHYPHLSRWLVYVTPPLRANAVINTDIAEHVSWDGASELIRRIWSDAPEEECSLATFIMDLLSGLSEPWISQATTAVDIEPARGATEAVAVPNADLQAIAEAVGDDGKQRAAEIEWSDPEDMERARVEMRDFLISSGSLVRPWTWRATTSGGRALTRSGEAVGYELRFSRSRV